MDNGKAHVAGSSRKNSGNDVCFKCHKRGHYAVQCPTRNLAIGVEDAQKPGEEKPYVLEEVAGEDELSSGEENNAHIIVMRCILSTPKKDPDWKRTSIFHTYIKCGTKSCKMIIDGGSCMNVISKSASEKLGLKVEPHPQPYKVAWVDTTTKPVSHRGLVPIKIADYEDQIWCDTLPMDVAHILLGRPWLYDRDVTHSGRANTCSFLNNGKRIILNPLPLKKSSEDNDKKKKGKALNIVSMKKFEEESK